MIYEEENNQTELNGYENENRWKSTSAACFALTEPNQIKSEFQVLSQLVDDASVGGLMKASNCFENNLPNGKGGIKNTVNLVFEKSLRLCTAATNGGKPSSSYANPNVKPNAPIMTNTNLNRPIFLSRMVFSTSSEPSLSERDGNNHY